MNINNKNLCASCFAETGEGQAACAVCGYNEAVESAYPTALPVGTILLGRYIIGRVLGKGGFGITYLAYDSMEDQKAAVKEYLPDTLTHRNAGETTVSTVAGNKEDAFQKGAEKFYEEAQMVSRFNGNPGLIWVYKFFHENNTAYFVMEYLEGSDLKDYIAKNGGTLSEKQVLDVVIPLIDSLIIVHSIGVLHRDISPDNIYMTTDGKIKLLDFGAARQVLGEASKSLSVILKQGFAPIEQYQTRGKQGPWTDIYALGATIYYCLTGKVPEAPMDRLEEDNLIMPEGISEGLSQIMQKMLAVRANGRYQSVMDLKNDMITHGLLGGEAALIQSTAHDIPATAAAQQIPTSSGSYPAGHSTPMPIGTSAQLPVSQGGYPAGYDASMATGTSAQLPVPQGGFPAGYGVSYTQNIAANRRGLGAWIKANRLATTFIALSIAIVNIMIVFFLFNSGNNDQGPPAGGNLPAITPGGNQTAEPAPIETGTPNSETPPPIAPPAIGSTTWVGQWASEGLTVSVELAFNNNGEFYLLFHLGDQAAYYNVSEGTYAVHDSVSGIDIYVDLDRFITFDGSSFDVENDLRETDIFVLDDDILTINTGDDKIPLVQGGRSGIWAFGREPDIPTEYPAPEFVPYIGEDTDERAALALYEDVPDYGNLYYLDLAKHDILIGDDNPLIYETGAIVYTYMFTDAVLHVSDYMQFLSSIGYVFWESGLTYADGWFFIIYAKNETCVMIFYPDDINLDYADNYFLNIQILTKDDFESKYPNRLS